VVEPGKRKRCANCIGSEAFAGGAVACGDTPLVGRKAGETSRLRGMVNIEGEWDDVVAAIKKCHQTLHAMGVPRISSSIRLGTRIDREQTMEDKIRSVEEKLSGKSVAG
jgi:uncharacterized protein (TIGR00106 family)